MAKHTYLDALDRADLVVNNAGAKQVFAVSKWTQFERFLILGSSSGTYYVSAKDHTEKNLDVVKACVTEDGKRAARLIRDVSFNGRAVRQSPGLFALAVVIAEGDLDTRSLAWSYLPDICRIPTTLFEFMNYLNRLRDGRWNRSTRTAISNWYSSKEPDDLAYQLVKYRQREGWTHQDLIRLSHVSTDNDRTSAAVGWAVGREVERDRLPKIISGFEKVQSAKSASEAARIVGKYGLPWEAVPSEFLNSKEVWDVLVAKGLPMTALIRQLPRLTRLGLLTPGEGLGTVVRQLKDDEALRRARIHPFTVLNALTTYRSGHGTGQSWSPVDKVVSALDEAFYGAFGNVEPTGKRTMLAIDCSGSMGVTVANLKMTARTAVAAMSLVTEAVEDDVITVGFTSSGYSRSNTGCSPLKISSGQRLDQVERIMERFNWGMTDCAAPMLYASQQNLKVDTFVIYTDNETWAGHITPYQALRDYRQKSGIDSRLIVVATTSTGFSIADPKDRGMLDIVGFDTAAPNVISSFSKGEI
jgi:60 kDa SS-A/Ro ribonucleoprotein